MKKLALIFMVFFVFSCSTKNSINDKSLSRKGEYPSLPEVILNAGHRGLEGQTIRLADYRGNVVLVNLWATWCGPCRKEIPVLVELQERYKDDGLVVVGLDVDESESKELIEDFARQMKINYTLGWIDAKSQKEFLKLSRFEGVPQSFLIGREGELMAIFTGGSAETISKLEDFVGRAVRE
ncbi:MAG: TlpA family protein disulfide reductase [Pyrinomonadaceae bacterium]|nr:TlpA family protein disulfide reductase [Pyrinomonadaceae bacterium]MCX7639599.1 TlpA family protein disulfide reductase [Pyrinomonadaceae bacterium]MDW8303992.1 TlpA disulfide reductase family protein [Acidobacteriota bacterium]